MRSLSLRTATKIAQHCGYEATLEDMLRDRLVCAGVNDSRIQRRLSEPDLTFKKAYELAQAIETIEKDLFWIFFYFRLHPQHKKAVCWTQLIHLLGIR